MNEQDYGRSFQHYENYFEASEHSTNPERFNYAIVKFFYSGVEPEFVNEMDYFLWKMIRPSIAKSRRQSLRGGGAPLGSHNNPNGRRGKTEDSKSSETHAKTMREFVPPTQSEVADYVSRFGARDPQGFAIYYLEQMTNSGWTYGKKRTPVKNWKNNIHQWLKYHKDDDFSYLMPSTNGQREMVEFDFDKLK